MNGSAIAPLVFWAAGLARLPAAIRAPERRPLCAALLCFALALTLDVPGIYVPVDRWLGVPNVGDLLEHAWGILGVYALLRAVSRVVAVGPRSHRWDRALSVLPGVAIAASAALFFAAHANREAPDFTERYGRLPLIAGYWAVTIAYFGLILVALQRAIHRHADDARRPALRLGLRIVGAGVWVGVTYSVVKIVQLALANAGSPTHLAGAVAEWTLIVGASVIGAGLLLPALETVWTAAARHLTDRFALLRLRRMWLDLTATMPEVVLGRRPSVWADLFGHDPSLRLYRRGIEVRDVLLATHQIPALDRGVAAPRDSEISRDLEALLELARTWPSIPGNPATEAAA